LDVRVSRTRFTPKEDTEAETKDKIAYTPIGVPLLQILALFNLSNGRQFSLPLWNHRITN